LDNEYVVAIILDPEFGSKLRSVAERYDLWAVCGPENRAAIEELWRAKAAGELLHDFTIWSNPFDLTSCEAWSKIIEDVELHHGVFSHDPPVATLEIFGVLVSTVAIQALADYEYSSIQ